MRLQRDEIEGILEERGRRYDETVSGAGGITTNLDKKQDDAALAV